MVIRKGYSLLSMAMAGEKLRAAANVKICWSDEELKRACETLDKHYPPAKTHD